MKSNLSKSQHCNFWSCDGCATLHNLVPALMLNSMQILPVVDISHMALLNNRIADMGSKGKCKAVDETRA